MLFLGSPSFPQGWEALRNLRVPEFLIEFNLQPPPTPRLEIGGRVGLKVQTL